MGITYHPVIIHTYDMRPGASDHAYEGAERFEKLNGIKPQVLLRDEMNDAGVAPVSDYWYPFWVWDFVPASAEYIMVIDSYILPVRPLPELPELKFAAAPDRRDRISQGKNVSKIIKETGKYFQLMLFVAHRDTAPLFESVRPLGNTERFANGPGLDGRGYMTPMNEVIQANFPVHELPKTWNWLATFEKEFYTTDAYMINCGGFGTWAFWKYILHLFNKMEAAGISP